MPLEPGQRLSHYRLIDRIGEGGMGVVWKAEDARLGRAVALKVLPEDVSGDPDRLARFDREARTLASLHHPNVASIFGFEEAQGVRFLVMELVDGEDLSERLKGGALPPEEAIGVARQIAEGLEAAHEAGVVHRDLKPANVKIAADGTVKVLDFGLAKALCSEEDGAISGGTALSQSPTLARTGTAAGIILGTAGYMSPEQARGKPVDRRSDIWSFGVVLYELLTGRRLHTGETVSDVLASVLKTEPDYGALPQETPAAVRRLLRRCLEREPKQRLRDIGDARIELDAALTWEKADTPTVAGEEAARPAPLFRLLPWLVAGAALLALAMVLWLPHSGGPATGSRSYELSLSPPVGGQWEIGSNAGWGVISPDGGRIVAHTMTPEGTGLWIQELDGRGGRLLPGTEDGFYPFWSPDGRWVAFFSRGLLQKIEIEGGLPEKICVAPWGRGGSWSESGQILLTPRGGGTIHVVPAAGGEARPVTRLDSAAGEDAHYWPVWLPDGERFLYFIRSGRREDQGIYLGRVREDGTDDERHRVVASSSSGILVPRDPSGSLMLLWVQDGALLARAFDALQGALEGPTSRIAESVNVLESQRGAMVSASTNGTLVWASTRFGRWELAWYDRAGRSLDRVEAPTDVEIHQPVSSPDGRWATFVAVQGGQGDIWLVDAETGESRALTSSPVYEENVIWSPDSREIIARRGGAEDREFFRMPVDGSEPPRPVLERVAPDRVVTGATSWMRGNWIVVEAEDAEEAQGARDLYAVSLADDEIVELVGGDGDQYDAHASPGGDVLAYMSDATGELEGYLVSLSFDTGSPATEPDRQRVPVEGLLGMRWSVGGDELFGLTSDDGVFAIPITRANGRVRTGSPHRLFDLPSARSTTDFGVNATDDRFLVVVYPDAPYQTLPVLLDWETRLKPSGG